MPSVCQVDHTCFGVGVDFTIESLHKQQYCFQFVDNLYGYTFTVFTKTFGFVCQKEMAPGSQYYFCVISTGKKTVP